MVLIEQRFFKLKAETSLGKTYNHYHESKQVSTTVLWEIHIKYSRNVFLKVFTPNPFLIHKVNYEYVLGRNPLIFKAVLRKDEFCDE